MAKSCCEKTPSNMSLRDTRRKNIFLGKLHVHQTVKSRTHGLYQGPFWDPQVIGRDQTGT